MTVGNFHRIVNPIMVRYGQRYYNVYVEITYEDGKLSMHGVEGPRPDGNAQGSAGQIDSNYRGPNSQKDIKFNSGWNAAKWNKLLYIWQNHHLNDLHAGTPKQEAALKKKFGGVNANRYEEQVAYLKSIDLYDDNGYKFGTGWLRTEVPESALEWLRNLENTKNQPAWV